MFVGVGSYLQGHSSNYHAGVLHLMTHAFFKAGLFLGAGSVMHAMSGEGDIFRWAACASTCRTPTPPSSSTAWRSRASSPFAGFWSKDAILGGAFVAHWPLGPGAGALETLFAHYSGYALYAILLIAAGCTSFYMFRLYFLVFTGKFRGTHEQEHHLHESPPAMTVVLWILALGSIFSGFLGVPEALLPESLHHYGELFSQWLSPVVSMQGRDESAHEFLIMAGIATAVSLVAIGAAWSLYGRGWELGENASTKRFVSHFERLRKLVFNKYYVDELYDLVIVRPLRFTAYVLWKVVDALFIDGVVNLSAYLIGAVGRVMKYLQNGDVQRYVVGVIAGTGVILMFATTWTVRAASSFEMRQDGAEVTVVAKGGGPTGSRLRYKVRWEKGGDDKFGSPQAAPTFKHRYDLVGEKQITVEAIDPRWGTVHRETKTVVVK